MIASLGGAGVGLVWGWLLALRAPWTRRVTRGTAAAAVASLVFAIEAFALAHWRAAVILLASLAIGLVAHLAWREALRARLGRSGSEGGLHA